MSARCTSKEPKWKKSFKISLCSRNSNIFLEKWWKNKKGKCSGKVQSGPIGLIKKNILLDKKLKVSTRKRMLKNRKVEEKLESTVTSIRTGQKKKEEELCEQEKYRHDPWSIKCHNLLGRDINKFERWKCEKSNYNIIYISLFIIL